MYAGMSANFGYSRQDVKWGLSLLEVYGCIDYLIDNPPAGTMLKNFFEALGKSKPEKRSDSQYRQQTHWGETDEDGGMKRPKAFASDEDRKAWERRQLNALKRIFGGAGGVVAGSKAGG